MVFTALVLVFQFQREKGYRIRQLESTLDNYSELTNNYILKNKLIQKGDLYRIDSIADIFPGLNIRISIINEKGTVLYDSEVKDHISMENHLDRPELQESIKEGTGSNIRKSKTTGISYYYYSKHYHDYFVRTAAHYDIKVKDYLHIEKLFIAYLALLFILTSLALMISTRRISQTITKLKDFTIQIKSGKDPEESIIFPADDLGIISSQIASLYSELNEAKNEISFEKDKLHNHLNALNEGIGFFTPEKKKFLTNQLFIQNLNLISKESAISSEELFKIEALQPVVEFIDRTLANPEPFDPEQLPQVEFTIQISNRFFTVKCIFFVDRSFEIVIAESTRQEKRKLIKQQMTYNISHELKTPVASVLGYLETLQQTNVPEEKQKYFIKRAYLQTERLSDLIEDISTLHKIEEAGVSYKFSKVRLNKLVNEVHEHMKMRLDEHNIIVNIDLPDKVIINGNISLIYSIFYNLFDNVIKYGGQNIEIHINNYLEDKKYYYFSFSNTGTSIDEAHFSRIFERFYRVDPGRSRSSGGTGLGLAIVKNAVELHKGTISARAYKGGGVEFLFSLKK